MNLVQRWWDWCSESLAHTFAGVTAPILLVAGFFVVIFYATQGGGSSSPLPPRADVAGVCVTGTPGTAASAGCTTTPGAMTVTTPTPVPPTPTPTPRTYSVQAGDTLSRICGNEVPDLSLDDCVGRIVELNGLAGPDEIYEGQQLTLPPSSGTGSTPSTTSSRRPVANATPTPIATEAPAETVAEPEPTREGSLVAIGPADVASQTEPNQEPEDTESADAGPTPSDDEINASVGSEYTVQAGDSLLAICVEQVPEMNEGECVAFVVLLNDLGGTDEITEGQTIFLP